MTGKQSYDTFGTSPKNVGSPPKIFGSPPKYSEPTNQTSMQLMNSESSALIVVVPDRRPQLDHDEIYDDQHPLLAKGGGVKKKTSF